MNLQLSEFHVERFRAIRGLDLSGLGRLNLLVGRNNSGKTSVLEALALFASPFDPWSWLGSVDRREGIWSSDLVDGLRWLFPYELEHPLKLEGTGAYTVRRVTAAYHALRGTFPRGDPWNKPTEPERRGAHIKITVDLAHEPSLGPLGGPLTGDFTLWDKDIFPHPEQRYEPGLPVRVLSPYSHWIQDLPVRVFSQAKLGGFEQDVIGLLQSIEPSITGAEVIATSSKPQLYLRDKRAGLLPLSAIGDGIRRAFLLALSIPPAAGGLLLIDELETAIHVSALDPLFRWLLDACARYRVQVFATTHSLEALDAILTVDATAGEDIVAYRLEREDNQTTARRYGEDLLKRVRYERGLDVR